MTSPYNAQAATAVLEPFGLRSFCRADSPDWDDPIELEIVDWDLDVDETRIPHVRADITIATPDATTLELLDPRNEVYIEVDVGYVYNDGSLDVHGYINLGLTRCVDGPTNTRLTVESEEAFVDDGNVPIDRGGTTTSTKTYTHELISEVLTTYTDAALTPTLDNQIGLVALPSPHSMTYRPTAVVDAVEQAKTWAAAHDAVLWCDQERVWRLWPTPTATGSPVAHIETGQSGNMTTYERVRSRTDGWANRILATYEDNPAAWYVLPSAPTSPTDTTTFRDRVHRATFSVVPASATVGTTGLVSPADPAVAELRNRVMTRGRRLKIDTVVHLWIRAGHYITVDVRGVEEDAIVAGYRARSNGYMQIITRNPEE